MLDYISSSELRHHGIIGMKWGVRRYQNEDGSLTPKGELRYLKVAGSERLQSRDTRLAKKYYKNRLERESAIAEVSYNKSRRLQKKASKYINKASKAEESGNISKSNKYKEKATSALASSISFKNGAAFAKAQASLTSKRLSDINDGTLKAGRDFISQVDYNGLYIPGVAFVGSREIRVIEKQQ